MTKNMKRALTGLMLSVIGGVGMSTTVQAQDAGFHCVPAHATDRIYVWTTPGRHAMAARGDGDTDLDFFVYDPSGVLVHEDRDATDATFGVWSQTQRGAVRIDIVNLGNVSNCYTVTVR